MSGRVRLRRAGLVSLSIAIIGVLLPVTGAPLAHADGVRENQYWLAEYGFTEAWATSRGKGVTVAVIDTGIARNVPELDGQVIGGTDVSGLGSSDGQSPVGDEPEHGTLVASVLAGHGRGANQGIIGVAPEARLLSISVALGANASPVSNDEQIARAVRWAVDHGAEVINMSLTRNTVDWPSSWDDAFGYAFAHDVVVVAAAGNRGSGTVELGAPATIPGVVAVAGVNRKGLASTDASSQGISIAVSAPSEDLVGVMPSGSYARWSGTSAAAPIVSGLAALIRAAHPELDANNVIARIIGTATAKPGVVPSPIYGYGLIRADRAVSADVPQVSENPLGSLDEWIRLHRRGLATPNVLPVHQDEPYPDPASPPWFAAIKLLPTAQSLALVTVPLGVLTGFASLGVLLGAFALRRSRQGRG